MMIFRAARFLLIVTALSSILFTNCGDEGNDEIKGLTVVDLSPEDPPELQLAVQACAGLYNRESGGSLYIRMEDHDSQWLDDLDITPDDTADAADFLNECVGRFSDIVRYSYRGQQEILPAILTVAAALGAVPLDSGLKSGRGSTVFDATAIFEERNTPYLATAYVFENYIDQTSGLAMLNPGYNIWENNLANPEMTRDMPSTMVDFVFSRKLFLVFLVNGCRDSNPEKELLQDIVDAGNWETPLGVYGYNNSWLAGGFMYEAQTLCLDSRNMGAIPTETGNLSFFSTRREPIQDAEELARKELEEVEYDPDMTYVAFVVGDGDNIRFIMTTRKEWLSKRLSDCARADNSCAPLTWSISPNLLNLAPDVLEWYYESSYLAGNDYFILPPSGHLYAYPSSLNEADQARFISATEQDARVLGLSSTVHWEMSGTWGDAEDYFLPGYARTDGIIRGVFPLNVPYMFEAFSWWPADRFFRVLAGEDGGEVVVFRPVSWRGIDDRDEFFLSPQNMADKLGSYPPGTVSWVYMTSDGGLNLDNSFNELVKILPSNVQLVSADTAARLALIAGGK